MRPPERLKDPTGIFQDCPILGHSHATEVGQAGICMLFDFNSKSKSGEHLRRHFEVGGEDPIITFNIPL